MTTTGTTTLVELTPAGWRWSDGLDGHRRDQFGSPDACRRTGLPSTAYRRWKHAQTQTEWGRTHIGWLALSQSGVLLGHATRHLLDGVLDGEPVRVYAVGDLTPSADSQQGWERTLLEHAIVDAEAGHDAAVVLLCAERAEDWQQDLGFQDVTPPESTLSFPPTRRPGAPMLSIRGGEERDLVAMAAMDDLRPPAARFHLRHDLSPFKHRLAVERMLAGLGSFGARELQFFVTEEGTIATAYVVMQVRGDEWSVLRCGDRDPTGARIGGIMQALIARDPTAPAPQISGWFPPGFVPPQAVREATIGLPPVVLARLVGQHRHTRGVGPGESQLWRADCV